MWYKPHLLNLKRQFYDDYSYKISYNINMGLAI